MSKHFTVSEIAELIGVELETVLNWIASGELVAINVTKRANGIRPRWRVSETELQAFLDRRKTQAAQPERKSSKKRDSAVVEFYK